MQRQCLPFGKSATLLSSRISPRFVWTSRGTDLLTQRFIHQIFPLFRLIRCTAFCCFNGCTGGNFVAVSSISWIFKFYEISRYILGSWLLGNKLFIVLRTRTDFVSYKYMSLTNWKQSTIPIDASVVNLRTLWMPQPVVPKCTLRANRLERSNRGRSLAYLPDKNYTLLTRNLISYNIRDQRIPLQHLTIIITRYEE